MFNSCHVTISHSPHGSSPSKLPVEVVPLVRAEGRLRWHHRCLPWRLCGGRVKLLRTPWILGMFFFFLQCFGIYIHILKQIMMMFFFVSFFGSVGNVWDFFVGGKGWGSVAAGVAQKWGVAKLPANNKGTSLHCIFHCCSFNAGLDITWDRTWPFPIQNPFQVSSLFFCHEIDICFCCSNPLKCGCLMPARRPFVLGPFVN